MSRGLLEEDRVKPSTEEYLHQDLLVSIKVAKHIYSSIFIASADDCQAALFQVTKSSWVRKSWGSPSRATVKNIFWHLSDKVAHLCCELDSD